DPVVRPEITTFGIPAHRDRLGPTAVGRRDAAVLALHEGPVDASIDLLGQVADLRLGRIVAVEIALREQYPAEQQRGIDGRKLGPAAARPVLILEEMIEKALVSGRARRLRS